MDRVAVIRDPREKQVASMMKMLKAAYVHKQKMLKEQTKERMEKHRKMIEAQEARKAKNLKSIKKEVFRNKSKAQLSEEKKIKNKQ